MQEWITAADAYARLTRVMHHSAAQAIASRAYDGMIRCRADRLIGGGHALDNADVPSVFWWARGQAALTQNWQTGDFSTWIDNQHWRAFGVQFLRSDIERMIPVSSAVPVSEGRKMAPARGTKIFIGHGHSTAWRVLKDFIVDRLNLPYDEFNAESVAGISTVDRLSAMLDNAAFAFLVLTAEDERLDGHMQARQNVVHEVGLFQGRLGFKKAIILLEDGCDEFSNATGLGQIRFPAGNIAAKFEEIRRVLERESIIPVSALPRSA
jgi:predicted nucleotide-binding protein